MHRDGSERDVLRYSTICNFLYCGAVQYRTSHSIYTSYMGIGVGAMDGYGTGRV